jgi:lipopolysaccharide export system permease protein
VGEFARLSDRMTLRVEESMGDGADLRGVFVRAADVQGRSLAVSAARGTFLRTDDPNVILLRLRDGTLVHDAPGATVPRVLTFRQHDLPVDLPQIDRFRGRGEENLERTLPELWVGAKDGAATPQERQVAQASLNRRVVQCVVMFLLPLIAVALAVPPKRSTSALGVFLSIILLVTYHKITEYGERMGLIGRIDPLIAQWVPYALFAALSAWMFYKIALVPGGQPIGALDRAFGKLGGLLRGLLVRRAPA